MQPPDKLAEGLFIEPSRAITGADVVNLTMLASKPAKEEGGLTMLRMNRPRSCSRRRWGRGMD